MDGDGLWADVKLLCDFLGRAAFANELIDFELAVGQPGGSILEAGTPLPELMAEREMLLRTKPAKVTPDITARVDLLSRAIRQRNHISADMPGRYTSRPGGQ